MCRMVTVQTGAIPLGVGLHLQVTPKTYRQKTPQKLKESYVPVNSDTHIILRAALSAKKI